jgi:hypothetical protein
MPKYSAYFNPFTVRVDFSSRCAVVTGISEREARAALWRYLRRLPKADLIDLIASQAELDRVKPAVSSGRCPACGHSIALCTCQRLDD